MKVLFAVNNDSISEAIIKKYQKEYKEIISYKNVYYFNAIFKELQNNKTYDRVVISEDLEPFANNNYDTIDKFLFEKLDRISDEATKANGEDIEIVLICSDRRSKSDEMLTKLFGIGIYNALIGEERNIDVLCELLYQPRTKKEAKIAYKIDGNNVLYQAETENSVSESEVQNILAHYKRLGKNEDKYVDSFNNIVSQYTDTQLRIIIKYLPLHVKAVLEERSPKYQELSTFSARNNNVQEVYKPRKLKTLKQEEKIDVKMLDNEKNRITKPIVIPSELSNKVDENEPKEVYKEEIEENVLFETEKTEEPKRGRGRPRKNPVSVEEQEEKPKRGRGRPKKEESAEDKEEEIDLFDIDFDDEPINKNKSTKDDVDFDLFSMDEETEKKQNEEIDLFELGEEEKNNDTDVDLFNMNELEDDDTNLFDLDEQADDENVDLFSEYKEENKEYIEPTVKVASNLSNLLTQEKKIVSFVGTTKNGTSFVVNNLGLTLANMNISTAILDMTKNKNSYYIFTKNEEKLRKVAEDCITNLENGNAHGIAVNKNLTVYTEIPGEEKEQRNIDGILSALMEKHDVVLIDTDFDTNPEIFEKSQEMYLVQSMDILTIQPLTAFLRNLKSKGILKQSKIKIIINKEQKLRSLSDRLLIGGMSSYNAPSMTLMTELFDKDSVNYCKIPFDIQNYGKYLDSLVNCEISLKGYSKQLLTALDELAQMVYPLLNKSKYDETKNKKKRMEFSDETQSTLDRMRKKY